MICKCFIVWLCFIGVALFCVQIMFLLCYFFFVSVRIFSYFFFFFQAEDGIRDADVTGVQTCALPIFSGLQIMGILESRTLDFENVIFTSMNEGKIPLGKSHNSFIPYDVKHEFGLPVYKDRDAIYTYHFYRLISRAKNIFLVYNTEDDGLDGGEKSRFITQLEIEKHPNHNLTKSIYNSELPDITTCPIQIEKSDTVMERLKEIAEKGFSPSSLSSYIRNPIDFYFQKVLKIDEIKEVEETIEAKDRK